MTVVTPISPAAEPNGTPPDQVVQAVLSAPARRIVRIVTDDGAMWLKRVENHRSWRWRLQKGDPRTALADEAAAHRRLIARGAPVAPLIATGPGWVLTADAGPTVEQVLVDPATTPETARAAVSAAARTLAALHAQGMCHGRPKLRDICWLGGEGAVLIDFERFRETATPLRRGLDLAILAHSLLETLDGHSPLFDLALQVYRDAAPAESWAAAGTVVRRFGWLMPVARLAAWWRPDRAEFRAMVRLPGDFARAGALHAAS